MQAPDHQPLVRRRKTGHNLAARKVAGVAGFEPTYGGIKIPVASESATCWFCSLTWSPPTPLKSPSWPPAWTLALWMPRLGGTQRTGARDRTRSLVAGLALYPIG